MSKVIEMILKRITEFQSILLVISGTLLIGIIIALGWISHLDFERSVINAELRELLIIAKSAGHDIESRAIASNQEPQYIERLIQHINDEEAFATFIMDNKHVITVDPIKRHEGKNIFEIGKEALNEHELSNLSVFVRKVDSEQFGTAIILFPVKDEWPRKELKLSAFSHFRAGGELNTIVVTERLSALRGPLRRNLTYMLVLAGLFVIVFLSFGYIFHRIQKKRIQTETTARALEIINKQLHCEIADYKCIENNLREHKRKS